MTALAIPLCTKNENEVGTFFPLATVASGRRYGISYYYRLDVLPVEVQYQWLKYATKRREFSTTALQDFAEKHRLTFDDETQWDVQSSGQMSLF